MDPKVRVSTLVRSHDDPDKVKDSVRFIFPDWEPDYYPEKSPFPVAKVSALNQIDIL